MLPGTKYANDPFSIVFCSPPLISGRQFTKFETQDCSKPVMEVVSYCLVKNQKNQYTIVNHSSI
jgi:hypothetical protein